MLSLILATVQTAFVGPPLLEVWEPLSELHAEHRNKIIIKARDEADAMCPDNQQHGEEAEKNCLKAHAHMLSAMPKLRGSSAFTPRVQVARYLGRACFARETPQVCAQAIIEHERVGYSLYKERRQSDIILDASKTLNTLRVACDEGGKKNKSCEYWAEMLYTRFYGSNKYLVSLFESRCNEQNPSACRALAETKIRQYKAAEAKMLMAKQCKATGQPEDCTLELKAEFAEQTEAERQVFRKAYVAYKEHLHYFIFGGAKKMLDDLGVPCSNGEVGGCLLGYRIGKEYERVYKYSKEFSELYTKRSWSYEYCQHHQGQFPFSTLCKSSYRKIPDKDIRTPSNYLMDFKYCKWENYHPKCSNIIRKTILFGLDVAPVLKKMKDHCDEGYVSACQSTLLAEENDELAYSLAEKSNKFINPETKSADSGRNYTARFYVVDKAFKSYLNTKEKLKVSLKNSISWLEKHWPGNPRIEKTCKETEYPVACLLASQNKSLSKVARIQLLEPACKKHYHAASCQRIVELSDTPVPSKLDELLKICTHNHPQACVSAGELAYKYYLSHKKYYHGWSLLVQFTARACKIGSHKDCEAYDRASNGSLRVDLELGLNMNKFFREATACHKYGLAICHILPHEEVANSYNPLDKYYTEATRPYVNDDIRWVYKKYKDRKWL